MAVAIAGGSHSPYYCGPPPDTPHASHTGSRDLQLHDLDTELTYHCHPGYVRDVNKGGAVTGDHSTRIVHV